MVLRTGAPSKNAFASQSRLLQHCYRREAPPRNLRTINLLIDKPNLAAVKRELLIS